MACSSTFGTPVVNRFLDCSPEFLVASAFDTSFFLLNSVILIGTVNRLSCSRAEVGVEVCIPQLFLSFDLRC